jgi:urease accessory protein
MRPPLVAAALAATLVAGPALAHGGQGEHGGFASGFAHTLAGWDHLAAMLAVGIWASVLGGAARLVLPLTFPLVMAAGAGLAVAGFALPGTEVAIALSSVLLGGLIVAGSRPRAWLAALVVGYLAVFHGHAHGAELPAGAGLGGDLAGLVAATALLHAAGVGLGVAARRGPVRALGAAIAAVGAGFLYGTV